VAAHDNLSHQFEMLRSEGSYGKVSFLAMDEKDNPVAAVTYRKSTEEPTYRRTSAHEGGIAPNRAAGAIGPDGEMGRNTDAAYPIGETQGTLFTHTPAKVDNLAVHPDRQGEGIGTLMANHAIAEHERRFGTRAGLEASKTLTKGSAVLATKLSGESHKATWGTERHNEGNKAEENGWAKTLLLMEAGTLDSEYEDWRPIDPQPKLRPQGAATPEDPFPRP
jgi:GNAT superfamily N-acetyltransferase